MHIRFNFFYVSYAYSPKQLHPSHSLGKSPIHWVPSPFSRRCINTGQLLPQPCLVQHALCSRMDYRLPGVIWQMAPQGVSLRTGAHHTTNPRDLAYKPGQLNRAYCFLVLHLCYVRQVLRSPSLNSGSRSRPRVVRTGNIKHSAA